MTTLSVVKYLCVLSSISPVKSDQDRRREIDANLDSEQRFGQIVQIGNAFATD
jgi:hypothetical protein